MSDDLSKPPPPDVTPPGGMRAWCAQDQTERCPVAEHVATDAKVLAALDAREAKMYGLLKWVFGGVCVVAIGFATVAWAQMSTAGDAGISAAADVGSDLATHKAESAHVHEMQSSSLRSLELHSSRQDVMLEMLVRDRGMRVPPPVDSGAP